MVKKVWEVPPYEYKIVDCEDSKVEPYTKYLGNNIGLGLFNPHSKILKLSSYP